MLNKKEYINKLYSMTKDLEDRTERAIFTHLVATYENFCYNSEVYTRFITKEDIQFHLQYNIFDNIPLPERELRRISRDLLRRGFPIITSSSKKGIAIADSLEEIQALQIENKNRALAILSVNKGYNLISKLLGGQMQFQDLDNLVEKYGVNDLLET